MKTFFFALFGYLSGSVLYAYVFACLLKKDGMIEKSRDRNPGTANAFLYGGFLCGILTLLGDLLKGFIPVHIYMSHCRGGLISTFSAALVLAAPVIGHAFSFFHKLEGGKGIAVTFGCLLGLAPVWQPVMSLAVFFLLFSLVLRITPHFYRTIAAYLCTLVFLFVLGCEAGVCVGFLLITSVVLLRLHLSREYRGKVRINLLWMH